jgi:hypothetical protein
LYVRVQMDLIKRLLIVYCLLTGINYYCIRVSYESKNNIGKLVMTEIISLSRFEFLLSPKITRR